ncbi:hypothetical protein K3495_g10483 [Podosphaera aphanis]|nr:hypothetical protein K3495_g10483 [Podosphaera aphanis]
MIVRRPLYGIPEAGTQWRATYNKHHRENLRMVSSTYDPCLLYTTSSVSSSAFGLVGMQTDDTLILCYTEFAEREEFELGKANIPAKPREIISHSKPSAFNECILSLSTNGEINLRSKGQAKNIKLVNENDQDQHESRAQRARGAYIASVCQPEACFDLSRAVQHQNPSQIDFQALNKRLKWQLDHPKRGLKYTPLKLETAKI